MRRGGREEVRVTLKTGSAAQLSCASDFWEEVQRRPSCGKQESAKLPSESARGGSLQFRRFRRSESDPLLPAPGSTLLCSGPAMLSRLRPSFFQLTRRPRPPSILPPRRPSSSKRTPHAPPKLAKEPTSFLNELIPHQTITLFDPATCKLSPPTPLLDALRSLDRSRYEILLLDGGRRSVICRIKDVKLGYTKHLDKLKEKGTFGGYKGKEKADWRAFVKAPAVEENEEGSPAAFN